MSNTEAIWELGSPTNDPELEKLFEFLPLFDKLDLHSSFHPSESSLEDFETSDTDSVEDGYSADAEDTSRYASGISAKAMKVLGVTAPNDQNNMLKRKAVRQLLGNEFDQPQNSLGKRSPSKGRRRWFRPSDLSSPPIGKIVIPGKRVRGPSFSRSYYSSGKSGDESNYGSPQDKQPSLEDRSDLASVVRVRKVVDSLEQAAVRSDLNKPLPSEPVERTSHLHLETRPFAPEAATGPELSPSSSNSSRDRTISNKSSGSNLAQSVSTRATATPPPLVIPAQRDGPMKKHVAQMVQDSPSSAKSENPPNMPSDPIALRILLNLDNLEDLRAAAMINKSFYETFRQHETVLVSRAILVSSPAAWELRQSVSHQMKHSPFRMKSVKKDVTTIRALGAFMAMRCHAVCRPETLHALLGADPARKVALENAIWRIWTFCKLFGKGSVIESDFSQQVAWLNGGQHQCTNQPEVFGIGNGVGVSMRELEDISEMWRCMEYLLSGFRGREADAKKAGIFSDGDITDERSATDLLQAWVYDILSLGPKAVLTLSSCDLEKAKVLGLTSWTPPTPGQSRQSFLRAAVEEVYRERLVVDAQRLASEFKLSNSKSRHARSASDSAIGSPAPIPHRIRPPMYESNLRPVKSVQSRNGASRIETEFHHVDDKLSPASHVPNTRAFSVPVTARDANTQLDSVLMKETQARQKIVCDAPPLMSIHPAYRNIDTIIIDPTDRAIHMLVHEMGFEETAAKRALAKSDTGTGVDVQRAIELLTPTDVRQHQWTEPVEMPARGNSVKTASSSRMNSQVPTEYCEGNCVSKTIIVAEPKRDRVQGLGFVKRSLSSRTAMSMKPGFKKIGVLPNHVTTDHGSGNNITSTHTRSSSDVPSRSPLLDSTEYAPVSAVHTKSFRENGGGNRSYMPQPLNPRRKVVVSPVPLSVVGAPGPPPTAPLPPIPTSESTPSAASKKDQASNPNIRRLSTLPELPSPTSVYSGEQSKRNSVHSVAATNPLAAAAPTGMPSPTMQERPSTSYEDCVDQSFLQPSSADGTHIISQSPDSDVPRARVTLTRVGTGKSANGKPWRFSSIRKNSNGRVTGLRTGKEKIVMDRNPNGVQGEIIGYAF